MKKVLEIIAMVAMLSLISCDSGTNSGGGSTDKLDNIIGAWEGYYSDSRNQVLVFNKDRTGKVFSGIENYYNEDYSYGFTWSVYNDLLCIEEIYSDLIIENCSFFEAGEDFLFCPNFNAYKYKRVD